MHNTPRVHIVIPIVRIAMACQYPPVVERYVCITVVGIVFANNLACSGFCLSDQTPVLHGLPGLVSGGTDRVPNGSVIFEVVVEGDSTTVPGKDRSADLIV